ncbi:histidine-type phosphatase [Sphingomonas phyllosphaerae]|uniref:histidine-type phosphatase n=1 Tax=Sphingomonas phyllosphaerae TaxID=257003 RepID=UPI0024136EEC|nr:histidine-type phosphatase [Sphingomonas phyllosphaerae]
MNLSAFFRPIGLFCANAPALALCASAQGAPEAKAPTVERVVMLMRHGVRPSTKFPATPPGTTRQPWPVWTTAAGDLTPHGAEGIRRLAAYDRNLLVAQGLLPASGCAAPGSISAWSSGSPRAIKTGLAFVDTLQPGCKVVLDHAASQDDEDQFHPSRAEAAIDGDRALAAAQALLPSGGVPGVVSARQADFVTLQRIVGVPVETASTLKAQIGDKPDLKGGLSFGSTAAQTILLQYLEGMKMAQVGWGRASPDDIRAILRFHPVKFQYETRPAYVAQRLAAPIVTRIVDALAGKGGRLTLLFGHDTNIAALGGFYDMHWTMADYPRDDIAPGGAIGFELVRDAAGRRYVRAFQQAQTMKQLRELATLDRAAPPSRDYIAVPGCGSARYGCDLATFEKLTSWRLAHPPG